MSKLQGRRFSAGILEEATRPVPEGRGEVGSRSVDLTTDIPAPRGTSATQEFPERIRWFFRETGLSESSFAGLFTPALRDAEVEGVFIYVLSPKFIVDGWVVCLLANRNLLYLCNLRNLWLNRLRFLGLT
jgi:hypothetical protein